MDLSDEIECTQVLHSSFEKPKSSTEKNIGTPKLPVARLEIIGKCFPIFNGDTKIGRDSKQCAVVIEKKSISAHHALIEVESGHHLICDLGSSNMTRLNGMLLKPHVRYNLPDEAIIQVADLRGTYKIFSAELNDWNTSCEDMFETPAKPHARAMNQAANQNVSNSSIGDCSIIEATPLKPQFKLPDPKSMHSVSPSNGSAIYQEKTVCEAQSRKSVDIYEADTQVDIKYGEDSSFFNSSLDTSCPSVKKTYSSFVVPCSQKEVSDSSLQLHYNTDTSVDVSAAEIVDGNSSEAANTNILDKNDDPVKDLDLIYNAETQVAPLDGRLDASATGDDDIYGGIIEEELDMIEKKTIEKELELIDKTSVRNIEAKDSVSNRSTADIEDDIHSAKTQIFDANDLDSDTDNDVNETNSEIPKGGSGKGAEDIHDAKTQILGANVSDSETDDEGVYAANTEMPKGESDKGAEDIHDTKTQILGANVSDSETDDEGIQGANTKVPKAESGKRAEDIHDAKTQILGANVSDSETDDEGVYAANTEMRKAESGKGAEDIHDAKTQILGAKVSDSETDDEGVYGANTEMPNAESGKGAEDIHDAKTQILGANVSDSETDDEGIQGANTEMPKSESGKGAEDIHDAKTQILGANISDSETDDEGVYGANTEMPKAESDKGAEDIHDAKTQILGANVSDSETDDEGIQGANTEMPKTESGKGADNIHDAKTQILGANISDSETDDEGVYGANTEVPKAESGKGAEDIHDAKTQILGAKVSDSETDDEGVCGANTEMPKSESGKGAEDIHDAKTQILGAKVSDSETDDEGVCGANTEMPKSESGKGAEDIHDAKTQILGAKVSDSETDDEGVYGANTEMPTSESGKGAEDIHDAKTQILGAKVSDSETDDEGVYGANTEMPKSESGKGAEDIHDAKTQILGAKASDSETDDEGIHGDNSNGVCGKGAEDIHDAKTQILGADVLHSVTDDVDVSIVTEKVKPKEAANELHDDSNSDSIPSRRSGRKRPNNVVTIHEPVTHSTIDLNGLQSTVVKPVQGPEKIAVEISGVVTQAVVHIGAVNTAVNKCSSSEKKVSCHTRSTSSVKLRNKQSSTTNSSNDINEEDGICLAATSILPSPSKKAKRITGVSPTADTSIPAYTTTTKDSATKSSKQLRSCSKNSDENLSDNSLVEIVSQASSKESLRKSSRTKTVKSKQNKLHVSHVLEADIEDASSDSNKSVEHLIVEEGSPDRAKVEDDKLIEEGSPERVKNEDDNISNTSEEPVEPLNNFKRNSNPPLDNTIKAQHTTRNQPQVTSPVIGHSAKRKSLSLARSRHGVVDVQYDSGSVSTSVNHDQTSKNSQKKEEVVDSSKQLEGMIDGRKLRRNNSSNPLENSSSQISPEEAVVTLMDTSSKKDLDHKGLTTTKIDALQTSDFNSPWDDIEFRCIRASRRSKSTKQIDLPESNTSQLLEVANNRDRLVETKPKVEASSSSIKCELKEEENNKKKKPPQKIANNKVRKESSFEPDSSENVTASNGEEKNNSENVNVGITQGNTTTVVPCLKSVKTDTSPQTVPTKTRSRVRGLKRHSEEEGVNSSQRQVKDLITKLEEKVCPDVTNEIAPKQASPPLVQPRQSRRLRSSASQSQEVNQALNIPKKKVARGKKTVQEASSSADNSEIVSFDRYQTMVTLGPGNELICSQQRTTFITFGNRTTSESTSRISCHSKNETKKTEDLNVSESKMKRVSFAPAEGNDQRVAESSNADCVYEISSKRSKRTNTQSNKVDPILLRKVDQGKGSGDIHESQEVDQKYNKGDDKKPIKGIERSSSNEESGRDSSTPADDDSGLSPVKRRRTTRVAKNNSKSKGIKLLSNDEVNTQESNRSEESSQNSTCQNLSNSRSMRTQRQRVGSLPPNSCTKETVVEDIAMESASQNSSFSDSNVVKTRNQRGNKTQSSLKREGSLTDSFASDVGNDNKRRRGRVDSVASISLSPRRSPRQSLKPPHSSGSIHVLFTGYNNTRHESIVKQLGGTIIEETNIADVLVTDKLRRTVKLLCIVGRGLPVVSPTWLTHSKTAGRLLDPWEHILSDKESEDKFGIILKDSLLQATKKQLLQDYHIYMTKSIKPVPDEMKVIVQSCGGQVLPRVPSVWPPNSIVISCVEDKAMWSKMKVPVFASEWLLSGVLKQQLDHEANFLKKA